MRRFSCAWVPLEDRKKLGFVLGATRFFFFLFLFVWVCGCIGGSLGYTGDGVGVLVCMVARIESGGLVSGRSEFPTPGRRYAS